MPSSELKKLPKSEIQLTITVPYADYKKAEVKAFEIISKEIKVDGFRAGHIPEHVIREQVDVKTIEGLTVENLLPPTYTAAVKEHDIVPVARPKIEIKTPVVNEGDDLVYTATVAVMPEVKMGNYKKIKVKKPEAKVDDKKVEETLGMIMDRFAEWLDVEREAKKGDRVEADFEGFENGTALPNTASKNHPIVLGAGNMIPGFEEAIEGMKKDEEKEFEITFPKEYHAKDMQGKTVVFKLKVGRVEEKKDQALDEALVEKITGQKQPPEAFRKKVEEDLEVEMKRRLQQEHDNKVVTEIIGITDVDIPEAMIEAELDQLKEEQKQRVQTQGLTWEQYLTHVNKTEEDFAKDHRKAAEDRLTARLGVTHIIKDAGITATDEEARAKIEEMVAAYPAEQQGQVKEYYKEGGEAYQSLKNNLAADKLIQMLSA